MNRQRACIRILGYWFLGVGGWFAQSACGEPYLAVQQGLKCMQCHVNPTGGGERNLFGTVFAQNTLPAKHIDTGDQTWTGAINAFLSLGGDLRANASWHRTRDVDALTEFALEQTRLYLSAAVIPDRLLFYVDEQLAPGGASNREAWGQLWSAGKSWYLKAGQLYLPFGWRLEDQLAFTRQIAGINMTTPDQGFEIGFEHGAWDAQLAVTNGTVGGAESNNGKQYSGQVIYVRERWRAGVGLNLNESEAGQIRAAALFAGVRTGPIAWLAEVDDVSSPVTGSDARNTQLAGLLEANWLLRRGHNMKLTAEWFDPNHDQSQDARRRLSAVYEWTPIQFAQFRIGWRQSDSDTDIDTLHRQQAFVQLHAFF